MRLKLAESETVKQMGSKAMRDVGKSEVGSGRKARDGRSDDGSGMRRRRHGRGCDVYFRIWGLSYVSRAECDR